MFALAHLCDRLFPYLGAGGGSCTSRLPIYEHRSTLPDLILPRSVSDMFDYMDSERFDDMVACAHQRWSRFVEIVREPDDFTQWRVALLGLDLLKTVGAKARVTFVHDTKCISDSLMMDRICRPFKHPVSFNDKNFAAIVDGVFVDPNEETTIRSETTPVGLKNSASMLVAFDGRRPAAHIKIAAMSEKALHQFPNHIQFVPPDP